MAGRGRQRGGFPLPLVAAACVLTTSAVASARPIAFGATVEDAVSAGDVRSLELVAAAGTALDLRLDHPHLDVGLRVIGPDGDVLATADCAARPRGGRSPPALRSR